MTLDPDSEPEITAITRSASSAAVSGESPRFLPTQHARRFALPLPEAAIVVLAPPTGGGISFRQPVRRAS